MKKYYIKVSSALKNEPLIREAFFNNMSEAIASTQNLCVLYNYDKEVKIEIKHIEENEKTN